MPQPIKILFDANPLARSNKSGVGYYTYLLIESLARAYPSQIKLVGHYFNFLGKTDASDLPKAPNISYVQSKFIPGKVLSVVRRLGFQLPLELFFKQKGDVALFTNFVSLPSIFKIPTIVAVHDLCYEEVPQFVAEKNRSFLHKFVPSSVHKAARIITISESTKTAIKKHYDVADSKFIITPIPPTPKITTDPGKLNKIDIRGKYVLFIGTLEPRKNIIGLVRAYEALPIDLRKEYSLVVAGGGGWYMEDTLSYIDRLKNNGEQIITPGYITDSQKAALYDNASLFILPSHYEGFGMPVLEAMSYGTATAVSDIPVFHEVSGSASAYFDKDSPADIARVIKGLLNEPMQREELIRSGYTQLSNYSWPSVVKKLYDNIVVILDDKDRLG